MARFDFIEASAKGYEFVWNHHAYLARVAIPVVFINICCGLAIFLLQSDNVLHVGFVNLPSIVADSFLSISIIHYVLYRDPILSLRREPLPEDTRGILNFPRGSLSKMQAFKAGMAAYMLFFVISMVIRGVFTTTGADGDAALSVSDDGQQINAALVFFSLLIMLYILISLMKFTCLYIPIAMGLPIKSYLKKASGVGNGLRLLSVLLVCSLPLLVIAIGLMSLLSTDTSIGIILYAIIQSVLGVIILAVQSIALTYGIVQLYAADDIKK